LIGATAAKVGQGSAFDELGVIVAAAERQAP
jgi:hypothetical protein